MAHLKGMDTWMWIVGGIIITLLCFGVFLEIFSSLTSQTHTQTSIESSTGLATDVNKLCMMTEGQSLTQNLKFSTLVTDFFSTDSPNNSYAIANSRTYGKRLCTNISGMVSCQDLDCTLELQDVIKQKKVLNFLDRLQGALTYREYPIQVTRTKCGVSALEGGSSPGCVCGTGEFDTPIQCDYNGLQPILLSKDKLVILTDAESWTTKNMSRAPVSEKLFTNIADYLGGQNILIIFEENLTNPENTVMKEIMHSLQSKGYWIHVKNRSSSEADPPNNGTLLMVDEYAQSSIDFSLYHQVWLITPGFCEATSRNCTDYARWTVGEKKRLLEYAKSGKGLLLVTDAAMTKGIYDNVDLNLINSLLFEMNLPFEQVPSCVCGCDGQEMKPNLTRYSNDSSLASGLGESGLGNLTVIGAAVFRETCVYDPNVLGDSRNASCGPDGLCAKNCPAGDNDCSCLEQNGYLCKSAAYCTAPSTVMAHADPGICCSRQCYLPGSESCPETHDKTEGKACLCTAECVTGLLCDNTKHCCGNGTSWNGTSCSAAASSSFKLIVVPLSGWSSTEAFKAKAQECFGLFTTYFPFKECSSGSVELVLLEETCPGSISQFVSSNVLPSTLSCARNAGVIPTNDPSGNTWRVIGIENSNGNIGGFVACSSGLNDPQCKMATASVGGYWGQSCSAFLHELGHTFGLCGEYCGGGTCDGPVYYCSDTGKCPRSCSQINKPTSNPVHQNCVMNNQVPNHLESPCYNWVRDKGLPKSVKDICRL